MIRIRFTHGVSRAPMADPSAPDGIVWNPARHSIGLIDPYVNLVTASISSPSS